MFPGLRLLRSIDAVKKLKSELHFNVNRQLALEAMFVALTRKRSAE